MRCLSLCVHLSKQVYQKAKRRNRMIKYWLLICVLGAGMITDVHSPSAEEVLQKVFHSIDEVKTLTYQFKQKERMVDHLKESSVRTRVQVKPKKQIYVKTLTPDEGIELLWVEGKYNGKALINPNGFPYFNVKLNPIGGQLLSMQHHPVTESGFGKFKTILRKALSRAQYNPNVKMEITGSITRDSKDCYVLEIVDDNFHFYDYTVQNNENLFDIAKKFGVSEYMMMTKNEGVDDYFDVRAGQKIKIPTSYASKTTMYIAKDIMLPIYLKMEDKEGLYELYEYTDLKVNPSFPSNEFDEDHADYGF